MPSVGTCTCINDRTLICNNITFNIKKMPEYLFFIIDIYYNEYYANSNILYSLFKDNIDINKNYYKVKALVTLPSPLHYTCFILNNKQNFLGLDQNINLYHDGKENNGFVIEVKEDLETIIKKNVCYIIILENI